MPKFVPKTKRELQELISDESVYLGDIDTSLIKDMRSSFEVNALDGVDRSDFNEIESWNVSNVLDVSLMFHNCHFFNTDISDWNVSSFESFYKMFGNCYLFNQPLGKWNTSKVRDVRYMFSMCASFKGDLNSWYNKMKG